MRWIMLATEDELSEQIGIRLVEEVGLEIGHKVRRDGFGYLKSRIQNFCQMSGHQPVVLITDLDRAPCPGALIANWLRKRPLPANLLLRVAVREIEAWLLSDHEAMRTLLGNRSIRLPDAPDELEDPKNTLLKLALKAKREVQRDLVPPAGSIASQGLGYNARLSDLIRRDWQPERAAHRSPSLQRARQRLKALAMRVGV